MGSAFLKCDAQGCDHQAEVPAIDRDLISTPCPKCGANLLTEADFEQWMAMVQPTIDLFKSLGLMTDVPPEGYGLAKLSVHLHEKRLTVQTDVAGDPA